VRIFATAILLAACGSVPAVGQQIDAEKVALTIQKLSPTSFGYEVTVKVENAGTQSVSLALSGTTHPTHSLDIQQWDKNLGWQSVGPCLDVPPDTTQALAPGESFEDVVPIGDTSHGFVSTICRSNIEHLGGKIRAVLCVYKSDEEFKKPMGTLVPCMRVESPPFLLPEPLHVAHLDQGPTKIVRPAYPDAAKKSGVQGTVLLDVAIGENGDITDVRLVKGPSVLAEAAIAAVRQWHYEPHLLNGKAVPVETRVTVNFVLPKASKKQGKPADK
jgi:TonB family protein